jgi:hypothetical protein
LLPDAGALDDADDEASLFVDDSLVDFLSPSFFDESFDSFFPADVDDAALERPPA